MKRKSVTFTFDRKGKRYALQYYPDARHASGPAGFVVEGVNLGAEALDAVCVLLRQREATRQNQ